MFDYIVIGAGSAGCVIAARLTQDPACQVLLIEAGGDDGDRAVRIPAAFPTLLRTAADWDYETTPQPHLDGRTLSWPRGRMLGGSSSLNAMMWVRGIAEDYDGWAAQGAAGWSYDDVLPYFKRAEGMEDGDPAHNGTDGPVTITRQRDPNPGTDLFIAACRGAAIPACANPNGSANTGVAQTRVTQRRGARWSAANAYLHPVADRPNLTIVTRARVTRIVVEKGRATGVVLDHDGQRRAVHAAGDVVLCAGAVNTPQLLLLSGIGPVEQLQRHGITPLLGLPGVGRNLQDHLLAGAVAAVSRTDTLATTGSGADAIRWLLRRRGPLTSCIAEAHAFVRSGDDVALPDLELIFAPVPFLDHGATRPTTHGYSLGVVLLQPRSTGTVELASADPLAAPRIHPGYLRDANDLGVLVAGMQLVLRILDTPPLADVVTGMIRPTTRPGDADDIVAAIRAHAETLYHPVGTCRMGRDALAVVDPQLRVRGISGLRIADASVMPTVIRGHTNAPTIMIAERAAELLRTT